MAAYPLPSWLPGPPDVANQIASGLRIGSQIQQEQQRLAQESNLAQMRAMLEQQQHEREYALRQQEMAQTRAYNEAQIGIRKGELAETKRLNDIKVQEAARLATATQRFQEWRAANPDKDPAEGWLQFFPGTGESATGVGTLARALFQDRQKLAPPEVENFDVDGTQVPFMRIPEKGGGYHMQQIRTGGEDPLVRMMIMDKVRQMDNEAKEMRKKLEDDPARTMDDMTPAEKAKLTPEQKTYYDAYLKKKADLQKFEQDIDKYRSQYLTGRTRPPPPGTPPPGTDAPGAVGVQFRWNPKAGKVEPVGSAAPVAAPSAAPTSYPGTPSLGAGLTAAAGGPMAGVAGGFGVMGGVMKDLFNQRTAPGVPPLPQVQPPAPQQFQAPSIPGPAFRPGGDRMQPPTLPFVPSEAPGQLFDKSLTPNSYGYGEAVRIAQENLSKSFQNYAPSDLVAAAKRLGIQDVSYNPGDSTFYAPSVMQSGDRDAFESQLIKFATEKNLNPLQ